MKIPQVSFRPFPPHGWVKTGYAFLSVIELTENGLEVIIFFLLCTGSENKFNVSYEGKPPESCSKALCSEV